MAIKNRGREGVRRRDVLALAEGLIGAVSLGACFSATSSHAAPITFTEAQCGDKSLTGRKILVAYASKYGSTGGVADAIGQTLCGKGATVDVRLMKNVHNLDAYQGVVLGAPVYMGKWLPEATDFVKQNAEALGRVPLACFVVCMLLHEPTPDNMAKALAYLDPVLKAVPPLKPVGVGAFAGALDYGKLSWATKKIMQSKAQPEGDFRDWKAIHAWAEASPFAR